MEFEQMSTAEIKKNIVNKLRSNFGCDIEHASDEQLYKAVALTVRDEIMQRRSEARVERLEQRSKRLYYLSAEFLVGRALFNNMVNLVNEDNYIRALEELGISRSVITEQEPEPGLGNGGLGRLAACFMDSLASLQLPAVGCTIRYQMGLFKQQIRDGWQVEVPDDWMRNGNIWEIPKPEQKVDISFGGKVEEYYENGRMCHRIVDALTIEAVPYDIPIVGYDCPMVDMLRVWEARARSSVNMEWFNKGNYTKAMEERVLAEVISTILYPNDDSWQGKELRLYRAERIRTGEPYHK